MAHFCLRLRPEAATVFDLRNERLVIEGQLAKAGWRHFVSLTERPYVDEKLVHAYTCKLDKTNRQGRIRPPFAKRLDWANFAGMADFDIETVRTALRDAMAAKNIKPTTLSLKVGKNRTLVKDLLEKNSDVGLGTIYRLADALDVDPSWIAFGKKPGDVWTPSDATLTILLGYAKPSLQGDPGHDGGVRVAAHKIGAALRQIAQSPEDETPQAVRMAGKFLFQGEGSHKDQPEENTETHKAHTT